MSNNVIFEKILEKEIENGLKLNDAQLEVVYSDKNTVVSAGAGSGKTTVLSYRFLRLITEGVNVDEILTITFTKKATAEMHERIQNRLLKCKSFDPTIQKALNEFSNASISTLDSFCSSILKLDAQSYGLSKDFTIISDKELSLIASRIAKDFLLQNKDKFSSLLKYIKNIDDFFPGFFTEIASNSNLLTKVDSKKAIEKLSKIIEDRLEEEISIRLADAFTIYENSKPGSPIQKNANDVIIWIKSGNFLDMLPLVAIKNHGSYPPSVKLATQSFKKDNMEIFYTLLHLQETIEEQEEYINMIGEIVDLINREKRKLSKISFTDVSELAVDILKKNMPVRKYFKNKFKKIMIDEFQDNNNLHKDLLFLLSEKNDMLEMGVPKVENLKSDKLFFVGDEKQSIYKFRGADVSVFKELQNEIVNTGGTLLSLDVNFRSEPRLIEHFNSVFSNVFSIEPLSIYEARHQEVLSRNAKEGILPKIELHLAENTLKDLEKEESDVTKKQAESEYIAKKISEIVSSDDYLICTKDGTRRPKFSDIGILYRTSSNQMNLERSLRNRGIPYEITESRSVMVEAVSNDFASFLRLAIQKNYYKAYLTLLRSPFCRLSDMAIAKLLTQKGKNVFPEDVCFEKKEDEDKYNIFKENYENLVKMVESGESITKLIDYLYYECGYYSFLTINFNYRSFKEHYEYLWSLANNADNNKDTLSDFVSMIEENLGDVKKMEEVSVLPDVSDGVKLMSIHKSKGLEFPIVILCDILSPPRNSDSSTNIVTDEDGNLYFNKIANLYPILKRDDSNKDAAELKRLLYVALTRSECHLLLTGIYELNKEGDNFKAIGRTLFEQFANGINLDTELKDSNNAHIVKFDIEKFQYRKDDHKKLDLSWYDKEEEKEFSFNKKRVSVTSLEDYEETQIPTTIFKSFEFDEVVAKYELSAEFGTLSHTACEYIMKGTLDKLEAKFSDLTEKENQVLLTGAKELAKNLMQSGYFKQLIENNKYESELRFYSYIEEQALEGVIDLIIFNKDYNLVIDFKTDKAMNKESHKKQLTTYAKIAREIYKKPCYSTVIYLRDVKKEDIWNEEGNVMELKG